MEPEWNITCNRFVAFFDMMGYKDIFMKNGHNYVLKLITDIKNAKQTIIDGTREGLEMNTGLKSFQFSDSFFIFSKSESAQDALNLFHQSRILLAFCNQINVPIKGAISFGWVTVDFANSIFVGQPIIDACQLYEELEMFGAILDSNAETKIKEFEVDEIYKNELKHQLVQYGVPTKNGNIDYYCLHWPLIITTMNSTSPNISVHGLNKFDRFKTEKFYLSVPDKAKRYVDNTIDFIDFLIERAKQEHPDFKEYVFNKT